MNNRGKKISEDISKTDMKKLMRQLGVTMQTIANYSGHSKTDVCRIMNEEMESQILSTAKRLLKTEIDKTQHLRERLEAV
jgi:predicted transcriptional regulator